MTRINRTNEKLEKLKSLWSSKKSLLIIMQDSPDPDAIAASSALKELAIETEDLSCQLAYGGTGGGHVSMASGQVNLRGCKNLQAQRIHLERLICERFLQTLYVKSIKSQPLISML